MIRIKNKQSLVFSLRSKTKKANLKIESPIHSSDSFKSLAYGVVTVTVVLVLVFAGIFAISKGKKTPPPGSEAKGVKTQTKSVKQDATKGTTYTVVGGEGLWDVAVKVYGDGFRWVDIADANNLSSPDSITEGMILKIPR